MAIWLLEQTSVVPKSGGTFTYSYAADGTISNSYTSLSVSGASYDPDFSHNKFTLTFSNNTTGSDRTITGTLSLWVDGSTQTKSFSITQLATDDYSYPNFTQSGTLAANGGIKTFLVNSNAASSDNWTVTGSVVGRSINRLSETDPVTNYSFEPHYTGGKLYNSVTDFKTASQNGEISSLDWVYVTGKVIGNVTYSGGTASGTASLYFYDPNATGTSGNYIMVAGLYDLGNVPYTPSNYTNAANTTVIGFQYRSAWGSGRYYSLSDYNNLPFSYTCNGVTTAPGARYNVTPPLPNESIDGYTATVAIGDNELGDVVENWITINTDSGTCSTVINQTAHSGSLSLNWSTMNLPGDANTYYNEITAEYIDINSMQVASTGSGNITPRIVTLNDKIYLRVEIPTSNIGGSSAQTATLTVTGVDGLGTTFTQTCNVTVNTDTTEIIVTPRYSYSNPLSIEWEGGSAIFYLTCQNISSITDVIQTVSGSSTGTTADYTIETITGGYKVTVTIPQNTVFEDVRSTLRFIGESTYIPYGTVYGDFMPYILQESLPEGVITPSVNTFTANSLPWGAAFSIPFTTEYMDDSSLTVTSSEDWVSPSISGSYIDVAVLANPGETQRTATITISGEDIWNITRTATITINQVPDSEGVGIKITDAPSETAYNTGISITFLSKNVTNIRVSSVGSGITISDITATANPNEYTATIGFNNNTGNSPIYYSLSLAGDNSVSGSTFPATVYSNSILVKKKCRPGSITVDRRSIMVPAQANGAHRDVKYTISRLTGTLTATIDGDVDGNLEWYTYQNETYLLVNATANTTGNDLQSTVTISGTDYNGDTITASYTVTQTADSPWVRFEPFVWFHNGGVNIPYDETATSFHITCNRVSNFRNFDAKVYMEDLSIWNITGYSIIQNDVGDYTLVINTPRNDTRTPIRKVFLDYEYDDDYGVKNPWIEKVYKGTYSLDTIRKCAIPGRVWFDPPRRTVDGHSGTTSFSYYKDQWMSSGPLSITHSGNINITRFSIEGDRVVIEYGENRSGEDRVETLTISGTDYQGLTITNTATLTQEPLSYIEFIDTEITLDSTQKTAEFRLEDFGVSNLAAQFVGNVQITNYSFSRVSGGHILSVTTADNLNYVILNTTITVTATGQRGESLSTTAVLHKNGPDGNITLSPSVQYGSALGETVEFTSVANGMDSIDNYTATGGLAITAASFRGNPVEFTIGVYPLTPVYWNDNISTSVYLTGEDYKGKTINSNTVQIVQYAIDPSLTVTPASTTMGFEGGTATFTVALAGPVPVPTVTVDGTSSWASEWSTDPTRTNTLRIGIPANNTFAEKRINVVVTSTALTGEVLTETVVIVQDPKEGGIVLDPPTRFVEKEAGSTQFSILLDGVVASTLGLTYTGDSIVSASFNGNKSDVLVTYRANANVSTVANSITVTGADELGNTTSAVGELFQYGVDPSIAVNTIGIPNTQASITVFVATNGVTDLAVSFSGDVTITNYTLTATTGGYNLTIETPDNLDNDPIYSTATFTGTVTTGRYQGQTITQTAQVIKYGKEGRIYADPSSIIAKKAGGTYTIDFVYNNMDVTTVTTSAGTFNADKSQLTYTVAENPNVTDRTITITITGTDLNGLTKTATITITQYGIDPYISITPTSKTLRNTESTATFSVTAYKVTDLTVSFEGGLVITNYSFVDGTLTVDTADNEELLSIMEIITISGVSENGETVTATANIIKFGTGGGLIIDPEFTIAGGADGENGMLIIPYITDRIKENTVYAFINGEIDVESVKVIRNGKFIAIEYPHNTSSSSKVSTLTVTCYDEDDVPRVTTSTITQLPSQYTFTIKPPIRWLDYASTSTTGTVKSENMSSVTTFTDFGDMDATTSYDLSLNGTITVTYQANSDESAKWTALSATGISNSGDTVTIGAWYIQNSSRYNDYEFRFLDSSQANITLDGGGGKIYYGIISARLDEVIPYSITGFVLKGYWTNLPSVRYRDGLPYLVVPINIREAVRSIDVSFIQEQSYLSLYAIVHQEEGAEPDVHPIWETSELTSPIGNFIEYHITNDGDIIYAGKAYRFPEEFETIWSVNDIVSNYLGNGIYFTEGIQQIPDYAKDFFIGTSANAKYVKTFYNSWAYEHTNYWLSDPIDNRVDPRQWLPVSFLSTEYPYIVIGNRVYAAFKENDGWTVMTNLRGSILDCNAGINVIGINNNMRQYQVSQGDYVLYYSNAYGGWDSLLLTGTAKKTDEIEHLTYKRHPRRRSQFSKINYQNNVTPTWTLKTGITIDGNKMYHLLESTMVYLHNLETNEIIPVVITNSQCEYLTYRNNGKRPYFYTITVEESNTKLRK